MIELLISLAKLQCITVILIKDTL